MLTLSFEKLATPAVRANALKVARVQVGRTEDAEDIVQEAFLWAWQNMSRYDAERPFEGFVGHRINWLCRKHLFRAALHPHTSLHALCDACESLLGTSKDDTYHRAMAAIELREVLALVEALPAHQRMAIEGVLGDRVPLSRQYVSRARASLTAARLAS